MTSIPLPKYLVYFFFLATSLSISANTAEDYEKALLSFHEQEFKTSYIHLKNALQETPTHLPSKLLMGRIFLIDGEVEAAIIEFEEVLKAGADKNLVISPLANAYLISGKLDKLISLDIPLNANREVQLDLSLLKANAYLQKNDYILATQQFERARKKFGDDIRVINGLAQMALLNKNLVNARTIVKQALVKNPFNAQSKMLNGLIYQAEKQYTKALAEFEVAYRYAPKDPAVMRALASSYAQTGNISKASKLITDIESQGKAGLQVKLLKARLLAISQQNEDADAILSEISQTLSLIDKESGHYISQASLVGGITAYINQNYDVTVRELKRYLKDEEPSAELIAMLAEALIRTNDAKEAIQLLERHEAIILENTQIASLSCDLYLSNNNLFKCDSLVQQLKQKYGETQFILLLEAKLLARRQRPLDALNILNMKMVNNDSPDTLIFKTSLLASIGKYEEALENAKILLASSPDNLTYLNLNIDLLIRLENFQKANVLLEKVQQQAPLNIAGLVHDSRIRFSMKDLQGASDSIQKALSQDKGNFTALLLNAQILIKQNKLDDAINQLIDAKIVDSSNVSPRELLVSVYRQQNKPELAIKELDQLLKLRRLESEYIYQKARLYLSLNQTTNAEEALNTLFSQWTNQPDKLVLLSQLQIKNRDTEAAKLSLKKALQQNSKYLIAQLEYIKLLLSTKEFSEANTRINEMQTAYPDNANVYLIKGHYYTAIGKSKSAYTQYNKAFTLSNNFTAALIELYKLATKDIHREDVISTLKQTIDSQPEQHFSRHLYADLLFMQGKMAQARTHYEKLILVDALPKKSIIYNNLANIESSNDIGKAMLYANEAVKLNSNSSSILDTLGWLHTINSEPEQGLNILRQAFTLNSDSPTIRYHLAYTLNKLGRTQEAKTELRLALGSDKAFTERTQAQDLLTRLK
ncbi:tetratricopeptide repeat protein [Paraglaciecola sp.]|uniref:tetratricopeptide repeat protein n=1 Tax=Paraglaciecola sp. TaxID=1920173 RepID=UPI0032675E75